MKYEMIQMNYVNRHIKLHVVTPTHEKHIIIKIFFAHIENFNIFRDPRVRFVKQGSVWISLRSQNGLKILGVRQGE